MTEQIADELLRRIRSTASHATTVAGRHLAETMGIWFVSPDGDYDEEAHMVWTGEIAQAEREAQWTDRHVLAQVLTQALKDSGLVWHGSDAPAGFTGLRSAAPITWGYALADRLMNALPRREAVAPELDAVEALAQAERDESVVLSMYSSKWGDHERALLQALAARGYRLVRGVVEEPNDGQ